MMLAIEKQLKFYRKKIGLTQEQLGEGICSVSYLSKIENGKAEANIETLKLLFQRLGVSYEEVTQSSSHQLRKELDSWYSHTRIGCKCEKKYYDQIVKQMTSIDDPILYITYRLYELHYFIIKRNWEYCKKNIQELDHLIDCLNNKQKYFYHKFLGLYYYYINKYSLSLTYYREADLCRMEINLTLCEEADFCYLTAFANYHVRQFFESNYCAQQALEMYNKVYRMDRSLECHILIGNNYREMRNYDKSKYHLRMAQGICEDHNITRVLGRVMQNVGCLHSSINQSQQALDYYFKSLEYKKEEESRTKLVTIFSIIKEYYTMKDFHAGLAWVEKGMTIVQQFDVGKEYFYHFKIMEYLMTEKDKDFEKLLKEEAIPFFEELEKWEYVVRYYEYLADYYSKKHQYKLSTHYYRLINDMNNNIGII